MSEQLTPQQRGILGAVRALAKHHPCGGFKIAQLGEALSGRFAPPELGVILRELESLERVVLYPLDNPREKTPADGVWGVPNCVGQKRHIVYPQ
jgi:hypothetical protein